MSMTAEAYREQIRRTATALAIARNEELDSDLAPGVTTAHVKMFTDGNLDKRFSKLQDGCELLADGFDDLDDLIEAYVRSVPLSAYDVASTDALLEAARKMLHDRFGIEHCTIQVERTHLEDTDCE